VLEGKCPQAPGMGNVEAASTRVCSTCGEIGYVGPCRNVPGKRHGNQGGV
jgi:hypothetical protein